MSAEILSGSQLSASIKEQLHQQIQSLRKEGARAPSLAVILVGSDAASEIYVRNKRKSCEQLGIESISYNLPLETSEEALLGLIAQLNQDAKIDGILVQLPLPSHIDETKIIEAIAPNKDVDGFHPYNVGRLCQDLPTLRACTPYGIMQLLAQTPEDLRGKHAVIVGASKIVGRPMALELLRVDCTVSIAHKYTKNLPALVAQGDIVIVAVGKKHLIQGEWLKEGAIVIDVGINRENGKLYGDVDFEVAKERASFITPVPGGVGPMTVAMLMVNTVQAWQDHLNL